MRVTFDADVNAAYIYLVPIGPGGVGHTYGCDPQEVGSQIHLDFDHQGRLVGIEVLDASYLLPAALLETAGRDEP